MSTAQLIDIVESGAIGDDVAVVEIQGTIDTNNAPELRNLLQRIRDKHLAVSLAKVKEVKTVLLATIVEEMEIIERSGYKLALYGLSEQAVTVMSMSALDRIFTYHNTLDEALKYLRDRH